MVLHVDSQREIRMSEIDRFAERGGAFFRDARGHGPVTHASRAHHRLGRIWLLDRPGGSAILAAGQQEILGPVMIDVIIRAVVLVVSPAETNQDLVTPRSPPSSLLSWGEPNISTINRKVSRQHIES